MTERMSPPENGAVVRMYCTGLGDCFLLGFRAEDGKTSYVLIDCGVWKGAPEASSWMRRIMEHIRAEVGERGLDLLVATHQHWDHLSGFGQAREIFEQIPVREVWLPWTENPEDGTAMKLAEERRLAFAAAATAASRLRLAYGGGKGNPVEDLEALLQFSGYDLGMTPGLLGARLGTEDLLDIVRGRVERPKYIRPALEPLALKGVPDLRVFALGPPTDLKLLGRDDPSTVPGKSEVYWAPGVPLNEAAALYAAAGRSTAEETVLERERRELVCPFDRWQRRPQAEAAAHPDHGEFFRGFYLDAPSWRQIETDWLDAAAQLALNLDDHINNTSLVLAFELGKGGPVLLFPGDAQVGNWLSWQELPAGGGVTAQELLSRTVLYKVGHHASHNATLKDKGLKMMTETRRLVAMIPVDEKEAHKPKGKNKDGWAMPYDKLLADLNVRTEGRVARADLGLVEPGDEIQGAARKRWEEFREKTVVETADVEIQGEPVTRPLFIQHTVIA